MAKFQRPRHVRHRELETRGLFRGPAARKRSRHLDDWIESRETVLTGTGAAVAVTFANATDVFSATAHGFFEGQVVHVGGTAVPTGFSAATDYCVISIDANSFSLAAQDGGVAVNGTTDGTAVTVTPQADEGAIINALYAGVRPEQIQALTDIDDL